MALNKVGAAWKRQSRNGKTFYSVDIEGRKLMIFKNERKEKEQHPDLEIFETVDEEVSPRPTETKDESWRENGDVPF